MKTIFYMTEELWGAPRIVIEAETEDELHIIINQFKDKSNFYTSKMEDGKLILDIVGTGRIM